MSLPSKSPEMRALLSKQALTRKRTLDGKFAKEATAAETPIPRGSLHLATKLTPEVDKLTIKNGGKQCQIKNINGVWVHDSFALNAVSQKLNPKFTQEAHEVLDYTALIAVDMLNSGDISLTNQDHITTIQKAVPLSGNVLYLSGEWERAERWNHEYIPDKKILPEHHLIYVSAWLRSGSYLVDRLKIINQAESYTPEWWWPYDMIDADMLLSDKYYNGEDDRLLERLAEIPVEDLSMFDTDCRNQAFGIKRDIAKVLTRAPNTPNHLRQQADIYIGTSNINKHYHCGLHCKKKHSSTRGMVCPEPSATSGVAAQKRSSPQTLTHIPCPKRYPCLLTDPENFKKRYFVNEIGKIEMPTRGFYD